jgi:hypothetical protein
VATKKQETPLGYQTAAKNLRENWGKAFPNDPVAADRIKRAQVSTPAGGSPNARYGGSLWDRTRDTFAPGANPEIMDQVFQGKKPVQGPKPSAAMQNANPVPIFDRYPNYPGAGQATDTVRFGGPEANQVGAKAAAAALKAPKAAAPAQRQVVPPSAKATTTKAQPTQTTSARPTQTTTAQAPARPAQTTSTVASAPKAGASAAVAKGKDMTPAASDFREIAPSTAPAKAATAPTLNPAPAVPGTTSQLGDIAASMNTLPQNLRYNPATGVYSRADQQNIHGQPIQAQAGPRTLEAAPGVEQAPPVEQAPKSFGDLLKEFNTKLYAPNAQLGGMKPASLLFGGLDQIGSLSGKGAGTSVEGYEQAFGRPKETAFKQSMDQRAADVADVNAGSTALNAKTNLINAQTAAQGQGLQEQEREFRRNFDQLKESREWANLQQQWAKHQDDVRLRGESNETAREGNRIRGAMANLYREKFGFTKEQAAEEQGPVAWAARVKDPMTENPGSITSGFTALDRVRTSNGSTVGRTLLSQEAPNLSQALASNSIQGVKPDQAAAVETALKEWARTGQRPTGPLQKPFESALLYWQRLAVLGAKRLSGYKGTSAGGFDALDAFINSALGGGGAN